MRRHNVTATFGGTTLACTVRAIRVEGNYYIPEDDVVAALRPALLTTLCYWKGVARYRHLDLDGLTIPNAAWTYPIPLPLAWPIRGMVAFAPETGIIVEETSPHPHPHDKEADC